ncbi:hypothetical protein [Vreelandella arcis]|uniref:Uncharacterized protein n=1 Tax=Vreelandella arcis TaxID=416873 RepID=A0A1H0JE43_9GAMM|nr:hypothetical protein [Halomonas arcis]SDO42065.1 hypothetical protein SAMN04487951_12620 [Halomonas arcis]
MSDQNVVLTFTGQGLTTMARHSGSGHWTADRHRLQKASYLVCVRNRRRDYEDWAAKDLSHGTAFLIAKITGVKESPREPDQKPRYVVTFEEYAEIEVPGAWKMCTDGQRFPVAYMSRDKAETVLGIDFNSTDLDWKRLSDLRPQEATPTDAISDTDSSSSARSLTIDQAKRGLSAHLGVSPEQIDINVRY